MARHGIVVCARWEADAIVEWVAYHKSIGFERFFIYSNDDSPDLLKQALLPLMIADPALITYRHFPFQGQQSFMYMDFFDHYLSELDWVAFLDADEFLNLRGRTIADLTADVAPDVDSICFNWLMFGNSGLVERGTGSTLTTYVHREADVHPFTKNIVRTDRLDPTVIRERDLHGFWHAWHFGGPRGGGSIMGLREHNVLGYDMADYYVDFPAVANVYVGKHRDELLSQPIIHHYSFKSEADLERRVARGLGGAFVGQTHWRDLFRSGRFREYLDKISAVRDTELAELWTQLGNAAGEERLAALPHGPDLAAGKPATQSSLSPSSIGATLDEDAAGALADGFAGDYGFHTGVEDRPWWQVDLGGVVEVREVVVFNRVSAYDFARLARSIEISFSQDGTEWEVVYMNPLDNVFGGIDGRPLRVQLGSPALTRYIRLQLSEPTYLHLHRVRVY